MAKLNDAQREEVLKRAGWTFFDYNGDLKNAPRQLRHLLRDVPKGRYIVHFKLNRIAGNRLEKHGYVVQGFVQAFHDVYTKAGWSFFTKFLHDGGTPGYVHYDVQPYSNEAKEAEKLTIDRAPGYYMYGNRSVWGPYATPVELVDAVLLEWQPDLFDGFDIQETSGWTLTEFGPNQGGVITEGAVDTGIVAAYIPNGPNASAFGRMAVMAPDMFQVLQQLATSQYIPQKQVEELQNQARLIVGHVNA